MSEIRASALALYAEEENGNPLLVTRDEYGVLRPVVRILPANAEFVSGKLKGRGDLLILETERG